jgi:hypothetical protein
MNGELENIWKKAIVVYSRYCSGICLEVLRKAMKTPVRINHVSANIRTEYLSNISEERSRYVSPFGFGQVISIVHTTWARSVYCAIFFNLQVLELKGNILKPLGVPL